MRNIDNEGEKKIMKEIVATLSLPVDLLKSIIFGVSKSVIERLQHLTFSLTMKVKGTQLPYS